MNFIGNVLPKFFNYLLNAKVKEISVTLMLPEVATATVFIFREINYMCLYYKDFTFH